MAADKLWENYEYKEYIKLGINFYICMKLYSYMVKEGIINQKINFYDAMSFSGLSLKQIRDIFRSSSRVKIGQEKAEKIGKTFNISESFFKIGTTEIINLNISVEEWNALMNVEVTDRQIEEKGKLDIKKIEEKVDNELKNAVNELNDESKSGGVVYNICYYFKYGKTYNNTFEQQIVKAITCLDKINYSEIFTIDNEHLMEIERGIR